MTRAATILILLLAGCASGWRVVDADTLAHGPQRYRLYGVDAPELHTPAGDAAKVAVERLAAGHAIACVPVPHQRDRYGRTIARCTIAGDDLGRWLVTHGHARPLCRYGGAEYGPC